MVVVPVFAGRGKGGSWIDFTEGVVDIMGEGMLAIEEISDDNESLLPLLLWMDDGNEDFTKVALGEEGNLLKGVGVLGEAADGNFVGGVGGFLVGEEVTAAVATAVPAAIEGVDVLGETSLV